MAKEIERLSLIDISPPSITGDEKVKHIITAVDPELQSVSHDIREAFIISRINELPENVLDLLAWQWHVDFYELAHNVEAKREMVLKSILWHRKKGTRGAIVEALGMLGVEAKFTAWHELLDEGAQPYTFVIDAKLTGDFWERVDWTKPTQTIRRAIQQSKAARSWMSKLYVYMEAQAQHEISVGATAVQGVHHDIAFVPKTNGAGALAVSIGTGTFQTSHHDIGIIQRTHSEAECDIVVGSGTVQGTHHVVAISQKTQGNSAQSLTVGTAIHQAISHKIGINQSVNGTAKSGLSAGIAVSCGAHFTIKMAA